jgi:ABC-type spermidine/putrescine transport system permease subunit I
VTALVVSVLVSLACLWFAVWLCYGIALLRPSWRQLRGLLFVAPWVVGLAVLATGWHV